MAAYESKFIVRFGAKNSRFPQASAVAVPWLSSTRAANHDACCQPPVLQ